MAASSRGRAVHPDSVLQQHAATDRTASSIVRLPVSGIGHGVGVTSPPEQDAAQLLPPGRITGIFHCILVLVQEESALIRRQLIENKLRVERILTLGMLSTHGVIVMRRGPNGWSDGGRGLVVLHLAVRQPGSAVRFIVSSWSRLSESNR